VAPEPKDLGNLVPDQVALSAKGKASAAEVAAKADGGAPAPTIASLFQAKAQQSANGPIAGAFVAGPDQPWGSRWVFAGGNQPAPEEIEALRTSGGKPAPLNKGEINLDQLKKLVEQIKAQGGDETQLKQAADSTLQGLDSAIASLGGELEGVRTTPPGANSVDADGNPVAKTTPNVLGGAEDLAALQGAKTSVGAQGGSLGGGMGGRSNGRPAVALAGVDGGIRGGSFDPAAMELDSMTGAVASKNAQAKPNLQVLPGGLATGMGTEGGHLEGGLRLSKDEPKLQTDTFYPNGMPLTAAGRPGENGAAVPPPTITGHVVPGAMMRDRLTSESLRNVANGISGMSAAGGGEMRIRLNPGNLGELMIRISTNGKDVGLKVQANDPAAKKVIEESLGALRDSLAQQSLALGRVDVTLATTSTSADLGQNSQQSPNGHQAFAGFDGQSPNQQRSMDGFNGSEDRSSRTVDSGAERSVPRGISARIAAMNASGAAARAVDSSRLDVMA
jgi:hypothetical protein